MSVLRTSALGALLCVFVLVGPKPGEGAECQHSTNFVAPGAHTLPAEYRVRVNASSFAPAGLSPSHVTFAVALAGDTWNEQSEYGRFEYESTTSATAIPEDLTDCLSQGVDYSLVVFHNGQSSGKAQIRPRCIDANGVPTQFQATFYTGQHGMPPVDWETVDIGAGEHDLIQTLVHEFGHALGLGHHKAEPGDDGAGVMFAPTAAGETRQRDLYEMDRRCLVENDDITPRPLVGYVRPHVGGVVGTEVGQFIGDGGTLGLAYTGAGIRRDFTGASSSATASWWTLGALPSTIEAVPSIDSRVGSPPTAAVWREDPDMQRVFYVDDQDYPTSAQYEWDSRSRVRYVRSSNDFVTQTPGTLRHCSTMLGFLVCASSVYVSTAHRVAVSWSTYGSKSITAWVHQNRANDSSSRSIRIAAGTVNNWTVPTPDTIDASSSVAPGLACEYLAAGSYYDCVIAFVDPDDPGGMIRVRRFYHTAGSLRHNITVDPVETVVFGTTAAPIAVWRHDDEWWMAVRSAGSGQSLIVYNSPDALIWTPTLNLGETLTGPSVVAYEASGDNAILTWR